MGDQDATYYQQLQSQLESEDIILRLIIAPPRTGSTLIENILDQIQGSLSIHEPFIDFGYRGYSKEDPYLKIKKELSLQPGSNSKLFIKDMSQWVAKNNEYERLFELSPYSPLFIIRNPLLSVESRIKKVIESTSIKPRLKTQKGLLKYLLENLNSEDIHNLIKEQPSWFKAFDKPDIEIQNNLLDYYAKTKGYGGWDLMQEQSFNKKDYKIFDEILMMDQKRSSVEGFGWESLDEEINYLVNHDQTPLIIDCTEFRLSPNHILKLILESWDLKFDPTLLDWKKGSFNALRYQDRPQDQIWYSKLQESNGVVLPYESTPIIEDFPPYIQRHINKVAIPIYNKLFKRSYRLRDPLLKTKIDNNEFNFDIKSTDPLFYSLLEGE